VLIWLMITPMMMKVDFAAIRGVGRRPRGLFVTLVVTALASALLLAASAAGEHAALRQVNEHLAYSLLLAWGEALVSGMIFSALVVFLPQAVLTYRQDTYLPPRRSPF
jgi:uncharacterized membrane protein